MCFFNLFFVLPFFVKKPGIYFFSSQLCHIHMERKVTSTEKWQISFNKETFRSILEISFWFPAKYVTVKKEKIGQFPQHKFFLKTNFRCFISYCKNSLILKIVMILNFILFFSSRGKQVLEMVFWFFWSAPFGYPNFSTMNQIWVQESILAWPCPHFHLVYWMRWDSNPQPFNCESSLLTNRPA